MLHPADVAQVLAPLVRDEVTFWMKEYDKLQRMPRPAKPWRSPTRY